MTPANDALIHIVEYDPAWPRLFEVEKALLSPLLAPWLIGPIEHVGSTGVPGLSAKPVIDIMAAIESLAASKEAIAALRGIEYQYAPYSTDIMHWFCKPSPSFRTHHLHLVPYQSRLWKERIIFRDGLRSDPALARAYLDLKSRLAAMYPSDREAYTDGKGPFIAKTLQRLVGEYSET
jgi:GrpB-like predicted nucleotidyltransferase (UPF0157 family)